MDNRRKDDAFTGFSGWWRSWPLLASVDRTDSPRSESDLDESADFLIWAAELAAPGDAFRGDAD